MKTYYVYILANKKNGNMYVGITNDLHKKVEEHRYIMNDAYTQKYGINNLVYYEEIEDLQTAFLREKSLKQFSREWKKELIEKINPHWEDLYGNLANAS